MNGKAINLNGDIVISQDFKTLLTVDPSKNI